MKYILCLILTSLLAISNTMADLNSNAKDSLLHIINTNADPHTQIRAYRNLADIYFEQPEEMVYLHKLYATAKAAGEKESMLDALNDIAFTYIKSYQVDSVLHYINIIQESGKYEETIPYLSYIRVRLYEYRVKKNDGYEALKDEIKVLNSPQTPKDNIYIQIEQACIAGCGLSNQEKYEEANNYLKTAYKLSSQLPRKYKYTIGTFTIRAYAHSCNFIDKGDKFIQLIEEIQRIDKAFYEEECMQKRPFYNINVKYLQNYTALLMRIDKLSEEKINHYIGLIKKLGREISEPIDKYNYFLAMNNYYLHSHDYINALATNDSLIKYTQIVGPNNVPGLLDISAQIYAAMEDYEGAYKYHKLYSHAKDSIASSEFEAQLNELQVKYDVDELNYKNAQLENRNKRILLLTLSFGLFISLGICVLLYHNLKKERQMKKKLCALNKKAEESENMKTAFLNSMCHEIRTPLNAIVGFSGLVADQSIDNASKVEFYPLITTNAEILTSLIDHLLVVANLDSSDELLPCERINIKAVCLQEMTRIKQQSKPDISYQLEVPDEEIFISSNEQYLSLVLENLLNNANKFTEKGKIILKMQLDKMQGKLRIEVKDTGCGIPADKQEIVFQRFSKLDSFTQGNGLGLYLSRLIIKRLSGEIFVAPEYIDGACLVINLPL